MKRARLRRRTPLRRGKPLAPVSAKRRAGAGAWAKIYAEVDRRSGGRCEICDRKATDHHHCLKPRKTYHTASLVIHLCRPHHERVEAPYWTGRLVIAPLGAGRFRYEIVTAPDKFAVRRAG